MRLARSLSTAAERRHVSVLIFGLPTGGKRNGLRLVIQIIRLFAFNHHLQKVKKERIG
jgi:hypothetical protein